LQERGGGKRVTIGTWESVGFITATLQFLLHPGCKASESIFYVNIFLLNGKLLLCRELHSPGASQSISVSLNTKDPSPRSPAQAVIEYGKV